MKKISQLILMFLVLSMLPQCTDLDGQSDLQESIGSLQLDDQGFLLERYYADYAAKNITTKSQNINTVIHAYVINGDNLQFFQSRNDIGDDAAIIPQLGWFVRYSNENMIVRRIREINSSGLQFIEIHVERPF